MLNLDLIYGMKGQTEQSWKESLEWVLGRQPEELYLYPLYVRELTGLGKRSDAWPDQRIARYREARVVLAEKGYGQASMRMFQLGNRSEDAAPLYCCQDDGMLGLGCGARSYTRDLHYSSDYAVSKNAVSAIIAEYSSTSAKEFSQARFGYRMNVEDQRRRYVIKSVLRFTGLDLKAYAKRFDSSALDDLPELSTFINRGWLQREGAWLKPTATGIEMSDLIGPALYSEKVNACASEYELR